MHGVLAAGLALALSSHVAVAADITVFTSGVTNGGIYKLSVAWTLYPVHQLVTRMSPALLKGSVGSRIVSSEPIFREIDLVSRKARENAMVIHTSLLSEKRIKRIFHAGKNHRA